MLAIRPLYDGADPGTGASLTHVTVIDTVAVSPPGLSV